MPGRKKNAAKLKEDPTAAVKIRKYTGKPTYLDQIATSLLTVFTGFFIASAIAIPTGILRISHHHDGAKSVYSNL